MKKEQKFQIVEEYTGIFEKPGVYLMDFTGLNVDEMTQLRRKLREADVSMRVVKNTLAKRALKQVSDIRSADAKEKGIEDLISFFEGPVGLVWSGKDSVTPARVLIEFLKDREKGTLKAGLVDGAVISGNDIEAISKLPKKPELQARVASALNAPIVKLAMVLNALPVKLALIIKAVSDRHSADS